MLSDAHTRWLAALTLLAAAAVIVVWLVRSYRRSYYHSLAQAGLYAYNLLMTRYLWRAEVRGTLDVPLGQAALIISNHRGPIDPSFIGLATLRPVHWMVAAEYFSVPVFGWALRTLEAIPTRRGGVDIAATKQALRYLKSGELVGVFPEGRINTTREVLLPVRPGVALVALHARVPVIPCYLSGTPYDGTTAGFLFMPARGRVWIGQPIDLTPHFDREDKDALEEVTRLLLRRIAHLAGQPHYEPQLAGRNWKTADNGA